MHHVGRIVVGQRKTEGRRKVVEGLRVPFDRDVRVELLERRVELLDLLVLPAAHLLVPDREGHFPDLRDVGADLTSRRSWSIRLPSAWGATRQGEGKRQPASDCRGFPVLLVHVGLPSLAGCGGAEGKDIGWGAHVAGFVTQAARAIQVAGKWSMRRKVASARRTAPGRSGGSTSCRKP
ncbi:hypothetical protein ACFPRL_09190 [Pseudoclavibacter helvolus]